MKTSRFNDNEVLSILQQGKDGVPLAELCKQHGISLATYYSWRAKYGGIDVSLLSRMKQLEDENMRLKKMYAEVQLQAEVLKEAVRNK